MNSTYCIYNKQIYQRTNIDRCNLVRLGAFVLILYLFRNIFHTVLRVHCNGGYGFSNFAGSVQIKKKIRT